MRAFPGGCGQNRHWLDYSNWTGVAIMQDQVNPYAPPKAVVRDAAEAGEFNLATRGSRLGAALLDSLTGFVVALPVFIAMGPNIVSLMAGGQIDNLAAIGLAGAISSVLAIALLIVTIILVSRNAQTIGKKLVGIKVARSDGSKAGLGRIFWLRNVVNTLISMIPFVGSLYGLVDVLFIFGEKQRCLHDHIADTIVIRA
jgi:uncharacterized RDD family membrane protein YckC